MKKLLSVFLCVVLLLSLSGCGNSSKKLPGVWQYGNTYLVLCSDNTASIITNYSKHYSCELYTYSVDDNLITMSKIDGSYTTKYSYSIKKNELHLTSSIEAVDITYTKTDYSFETAYTSSDFYFQDLGIGNREFNSYPFDSNWYQDRGYYYKMLCHSVQDNPNIFSICYRYIDNSQGKSTTVEQDFQCTINNKSNQSLSALWFIDTKYDLSPIYESYYYLSPNTYKTFSIYNISVPDASKKLYYFQGLSNIIFELD